MYKPQSISVAAGQRTDDYASRMLALKIDLIREYCGTGILVDVCCSTGQQLAELAPGHRLAVGIDFSMPFLEHGRPAGRAAHVHLVCGNARALPLGTGSIDGAYSLSSLYHIPDVGAVIAEIGRVLRPGRRCLLDMGNRRSFNNIVCLAYPELAAPCHVRLDEMFAMIRSAGMRILVHRSFQILPMWGDRPRSLKWLLAPGWIRWLAKRVGGRMLDEWISSLPFVRRYAFRQVFVCERVANDG